MGCFILPFGCLAARLACGRNRLKNATFYNRYSREEAAGLVEFFRDQTETLKNL